MSVWDGLSFFVRGMMDEEEQFVAYFLPTDETVEKRREDRETARDYDPEAK